MPPILNRSTSKIHLVTYQIRSVRNLELQTNWIGSGQPNGPEFSCVDSS